MKKYSILNLCSNISFEVELFRETKTMYITKHTNDIGIEIVNRFNKKSLNNTIDNHSILLIKNIEDIENIEEKKESDDCLYFSYMFKDSKFYQETRKEIVNFHADTEFNSGYDMDILTWFYCNALKPNWFISRLFDSRIKS